MFNRIYWEYRCNSHTDGYNLIVCEIIGQMLSNKVADVLYKRIEESCEGKISPEKMIALSVSGLRESGISRSKAECIIHISEMVLDGTLNMSELYQQPDTEVYRTLTSIKGIGAWTAKMFLLFGKQSQDILPYEDGAFLQTYKWLYSTSKISPLAVKNKCISWSPYSSIASRYFYRALDTKITEQNVNLILERAQKNEQEI